MITKEEREFGERFKKFRSYIGLSRREMAKRYPLNEKTIKECEEGKYIPDYWTLNWVCEEWGVSPDFILYGEPLEEELDHPFVKSFGTSSKTCWRCGINFTGTETHEREYCSDCQEKHEEEDKELLDKYLELKTRVMWRRAVNDLEKQWLNMDEYYEESKYVLELALSDYNKFRSSPEMMAGIELLKNRVRAKTEYPILRYKVDFFLPDLKVVLEIDGRLHDFKVKKDSNRDVAILNELNKNDTGWEIIRIPTKYILENVKQLVPAIKAVYEEKQRLRRENGGFIPSYFSKRDLTQQLKAISDIDTEEAKKDRDNLKDHMKDWKTEEL